MRIVFIHLSLIQFLEAKRERGGYKNKDGLGQYGCSVWKSITAPGVNESQAGQCFW